MKLDFNLNNEIDMPELILGKRNFHKLGSVTNIENLSYEYNLMSADKIDFAVHKFFHQKECRLWEELKDRRLIFVKEFNEWFEISVKTDETNELKKTITGTSLCESELSQALIVETEVNTENDIARPDYTPTVFYNPSVPSASLLHRLLKKVPNYSIRYVASNLWNIQRTFSINGSSVYDALMGEIAEEIGCLFLFNSVERSISVYDLKTTCNHCGYRSDFTDICPICNSTDLSTGYGRDTAILIDSENLTETISLEGKSSEVKNYFRIIGGDDTITSYIRACNPSGTNYIYAFSDEDKQDMSHELQEKLNSYQKKYKEKKPLYNEITKKLYNAIDEKLNLESLMMPKTEHAKTSAQKELSKLTSAALSPVAVTDVSIASVFTAGNAVLAMAKCIVNSTVYKVSLIDKSTSFENQRWRGKFRLENYSDENDCAENTAYITVIIDDDYERYVKQKIQKTIDRDDIYLTNIFDKDVSLNTFKAELKKYCLNRLNSFESAYQSVLEVLTEAQCSNHPLDNTSDNASHNILYQDIYDNLYLPSFHKLSAIQAEIKVRTAEIEAAENKYNQFVKNQEEIQKELNLEHYLGETLWKELCAFCREDTYENPNYISDGLNDSQALKKAEQLFSEAEKHAIKASTLQFSLTANMHNLLTIPEFKNLTNEFEGGNWIRVRIDNKLYRLRLIHYSIQFSELQSINVEFSDVTRTANGLSDINSLMSKVQSMSSGYPYTVHQAEQGEKGFTAIEQIKNDGLNTALYQISNSVHQEFKIDEHGFLGRQWDDILSDYLPEQFKINHNLLVYTDDCWQTAKAALGKITYYNPVLKTTVSNYGLIADAVISGILMGNDIIGGNIYSENYGRQSGTHMDLNTGDFSFAGGKLTYDSKKNALNITGKITFEEIDYSDNNAMEHVKDSLGITDVENDIGEFNNASVLTPLEKKTMSENWRVIQEEYKKNMELAEVFGLYTNNNNSSDDDQTVIDYMNFYHVLSGQIQKCGLNNPAVSTSIDTRIYSDIENYHIADIKLTNKINEKAKEFSDEAYRIAMQAVSDGVLTPSEKRDLINEINSIKAAYAKYTAVCNALNISCTAYTAAYNTLIHHMTGSSGVYKLNVSCDTALTSAQVESFKKYFADYYTEEANIIECIQEITKNNISKAQEAADKAQEAADKAQETADDAKRLAENANTLGGELMKCLGYTTEIAKNYIISPYIGGGYLNITGGRYGSVIIDPLGIKNSSYIFGVYNSSNKMVMGVDTSGNGVFEGKVMAESGKIGGWNLDANRIYMSDTGMSSYGGYHAFWAGETNGAHGKINSNAKFRVGHDGHLVAENADISGKISADDGKIGGWNLNSSSIYRNSSTFGASNGMYFGTNGLSIGNYFKISSGGTLTSGSSTNYVTLDNGSLKFYTDGKATAAFSDVVWKDTSTYGTAVHLEDYAHFVTFGRMASGTSSYTTSFLINYGLNPNGRTEDVIAFGSFLSTGDVMVDGRLGLHHSSTNVVYVGSTFVDNDYYAVVVDNLYVKNNLYVNGANKTRVVDTINYGSVCMNAYETTTPYFGDIGSGICDKDGLCYIYLDEIFKETIIEDYKYYIFLQSIGENPVFLLEQNNDYFIVKGQKGQKFNFEIKCRQKGTETSRMNQMTFENKEDYLND